MDTLDIDIQIESKLTSFPSSQEFIKWVKASLEAPQAEITIRIVDEEESAHLNETYRKKMGPTNVLSFPFSSMIDNILHGDIVFCAPIIQKEAETQLKPLHDHWAHLTVHGILHLQGYDHIEKEDAKVMEQQEVKILSALGIANPYD